MWMRGLRIRRRRVILRIRDVHVSGAIPRRSYGSEDYRGGNRGTSLNLHLLRKERQHRGKCEQHKSRLHDEACFS